MINFKSRLANNPSGTFLMNRINLLLLIVVLVSCSKTLDIQLEPEVKVFLSNDTEQIISLTQKDEAYVVLNEWLHENRSDWHATSGRYPGGVYVKSGNYGIQVTESHVVIYSTASNETKALYIQAVEKGELSIISNFGQ